MRLWSLDREPGNLPSPERLSPDGDDPEVMSAWSRQRQPEIPVAAECRQRGETQGLKNNGIKPAGLAAKASATAGLAAKALATAGRVPPDALLLSRRQQK